MKVYGLFKVINKNNREQNNELYNILHPEHQLNSIRVEQKTFLDFFFHDNPAILKADIGIQYIEYNKFKRELEEMTSKKYISQYERQFIDKMLLKVIVAENKFLKYNDDISKVDNAIIENKKIINNLVVSQPIFAENINKYLELYYSYLEQEEDCPEYLKQLFDIEHLEHRDKYTDTVMYPNSIISFYRTGIQYSEGKIILDNIKSIAEYIVFELDINQSIKFNIENNENEKINKLKHIISLCEEISVSPPEDVIAELNQTHYVEHIYNQKRLIIYRIKKGQIELIYEIIDI